MKYDERKDFDLPNRDVMLAETLEWLRVAVLPSLNVLEKIVSRSLFFRRTSKNLPTISFCTTDFYSYPYPSESRFLSDFGARF